MIRFDLIKKEWIVSRTARRIYRASALVSVALFVGLVALGVNGGFLHTLAPIGRPLLFIGALGTGITVVGMEIFLFRMDDFHPVKQVFWFCVMVFPLVGAPLYCFVVYSRSPQVRKCLPDSDLGYRLPR